VLGANQRILLNNANNNEDKNQKSGQMKARRCLSVKTVKTLIGLPLGFFLPLFSALAFPFDRGIPSSESCVVRPLGSHQQEAKLTQKITFANRKGKITNKPLKRTITNKTKKRNDIGRPHGPL
jgi:hypothetical protein